MSDLKTKLDLLKKSSEVVPTTTALKSRLKNVRSSVRRNKAESAWADYLDLVVKGAPLDNEQDVANAIAATIRYAGMSVTPEMLYEVLLGCAGRFVDKLKPMIAAGLEASIPLHADWEYVKTGPRAGKPEGSTRNFERAFSLLETHFRYDTFADTKVVVRQGVTEPFDDSTYGRRYYELEQHFNIKADDTELKRWCSVPSKSRHSRARESVACMRGFDVHAASACGVASRSARRSIGVCQLRA